MINRILIVEDEILVAEDVAAALEDYGYVVSGIAVDAEEALQSIEQQQPHLILLDIQLKGKKTGIDLAHEINKKYHIPLLFLTSNSDRATLSKALEAFPKAFLSKPFNEKDLTSAIEIALQDQSTSESAKSTVQTSQTSSVFVKDKDRFRKIDLADILYVEADGSYCKLYTRQGSFVLTMNSQQFLNSVSNSESVFIRVHRSYVVNAGQVEEFDNHYVFFGETSIPVSKSGQKELMKYLNKL